MADGLENAAFGLKVRGIPEQERKRIVMEYLNLVGLAEFYNSPIYKNLGRDGEDDLLHHPQRGRSDLSGFNALL